MYLGRYLMYVLNVGMSVMHLISRPMNGESLCGIDLSVPMKSTCVQSKVINLWSQHQLPFVYPISKTIEYSIEYVCANIM